MSTNPVQTTHARTRAHTHKHAHTRAHTHIAIPKVLMETDHLQKETLHSHWQRECKRRGANCCCCCCCGPCCSAAMTSEPRSERDELGDMAAATTCWVTAAVRSAVASLGSGDATKDGATLSGADAMSPKASTLLMSARLSTRLTGAGSACKTAAGCSDVDKVGPTSSAAQLCGAVVSRHAAAALTSAMAGCTSVIDWRIVPSELTPLAAAQRLSFDFELKGLYVASNWRPRPPTAVRPSPSWCLVHRMRGNPRKAPRVGMPRRYYDMFPIKLVKGDRCR